MTVADLQDYLNQLGCTPPLDEDDVLGPLTKAALANFQNMIPPLFRDPDRPDGMPGPITEACIQFALEIDAKPLEPSK